MSMKLLNISVTSNPKTRRRFELNELFIWRRGEGMGYDRGRGEGNIVKSSTRDLIESNKNRP